MSVSLEKWNEWLRDPVTQNYIAKLRENVEESRASAAAFLIDGQQPIAVGEAAKAVAYNGMLQYLQERFVPAPEAPEAEFIDPARRTR